MDSQAHAEHPVTSVSPFAAMLRASIAPSAVVGLVCVLVFGVLRGVSGGVSAAFAVALTIGFFASGLAVLSMVRRLSSGALMAAGMAIFFGQVIILGVVLMVARSVEALDGPATGITVAVVVVAWQIFQVRSFLRTKQYVYDPDAVGGSA